MPSDAYIILSDAYSILLIAYDYYFRGIPSMYFFQNVLTLHKEGKHHLSYIHYTPFMCTGGMIVMQHFENVLMSLHLFKKYFINIKFIVSWFLNQLVQ